METTLVTLVAVGVGFLGSLLVQLVQGKQSRERERLVHEHQLKQAEEAHKHQLERDKQEYERNQADTRKEQIRTECAALLEAALTFYHLMISYGERKKVTEGIPNIIIPLPEARLEISRLSTLLRDALVRIDKATVALMLLEPNKQVISEDLRIAMERLTVAVENTPTVEQEKTRTEKAIKINEDAKHTIFWGVRELREALPKQISQL